MPDSRVPTIDEMIELPLPSDPQMSPDGRHVAYVVRTPDWKQNAYVTQVWLVGVDDPQPRQLTFAKQASSAPRWSPDGQWLAFVAKRDGDNFAQIYRLSPFGGEAERLTELEADIQTLAWSPDGQSIAFIAPDPESESLKQRKEKYGDYQVEDQDYTRAHLWQLELADRKCRKLTSGGAFHVMRFDWQPQGNRIAFESWPTPDFRDFMLGVIYAVDVATLEITPLTYPGYGSPRWSPDGTQLACIRAGAPTFYGNSRLCVLPADGGEIRAISESFDESPLLHEWGTNGIYFTAVQRAEAPLFRIDPGSGQYTRLTPDDPPGWAGMEFGLDRAGSRVALAAATALHCMEIWLLDLSSGAARRLTDFNAKTADWPRTQHESFQWTSTDGTPIEGVVTKPADFDPSRQYPLLVVIHGGPTATSLMARFDRTERYYYPIQQWAAKGALVLQPNYRGSGGYGEVFRSLNVRNLGIGDYSDVISGVDALIAKGWVDPERVGAMGWSQGGYISAFITTYSDRFKAVSVGAGISSWYTYYVNTDIHPFTRTYLEATPWSDADIYAKTSPMTYIKNAKTPTLIQHGEFDRRVPIPNAYELYQGLQDMGVETRLVVYKGMPHGITQPRLNRQVMQENFDWFNTFLWGESPGAEPTTVYIALCSGAQQQTPGDLPAIERYTAAWTRDVYHWARRDGVEYRILSGEFGLLKASDPIPCYHHQLAPDEVSLMAARVAEQLKTDSLKKLIVFTPETKKIPAVLFYVACLQVAAGMLGGVTVEHRQASDAGWG